MKLIMKPLALLIVCFTLVNAGYAQVKTGDIAGISTSRLEHYEAFIEEEISSGKIPGAVSLIVRDGKIVQNKSYGYGDLETRKEMHTDDVFFIQSMTKPIINVAFMMLFEEGHFLLNDPVEKYLPEFKDITVTLDRDKGKAGPTEPLARPITIIDLLTHTSGLTHGLGGNAMDKEVYKDQYMQPHKSIQDRVASLIQFPLMSQPGTEWRYSAAPDVLSVLIEKFSGMPTNQFLQERIFDPLEMKSTGYNVLDADFSHVAKVAELNDAGRLNNAAYQPPTSGNTVWSGVNGLYSNASDYMAFCQMMLNDGELNGKRLLSPKTVAFMTANHVGDLFTAPGEGYGIGVAMITDVAATNNLGSLGLYYWGGAYNTHFFIDPSEKLVAIFMTHTTAFTWFYHQKMRQLIYQALVD